MNYKFCLKCFAPLKSTENLLHATCSMMVFGHSTPPTINFSFSQITELALKAINQSLSIPGVQRKISASLISSSTNATRLTIADGMPGYIVKTPFPDYPQIVENEALTMQLAREIGLRAAQSTLLPLESGELVLAIKRFDRQGEKKLALEDFCQLLDQQTSEKYTGSIEKIGRFIKKHGSTPGLDCAYLFELVLYSFITGNADMHLKNFSLFTKEGQIRLTPAYDLLNTKILVPEDAEESALTINGKKRKLKREDFVAMGTNIGLPPKVISNIINGLLGKREKILQLVDLSFLEDELKERYRSITLGRLEKLF